jgi:hypothetical protein
MANLEHIERLKGGNEDWNRWRRDNNVKPDFTDSQLGGTDLDGFNLIFADFEGSNLGYATFRFAELAGANLSGTDLTGTNFAGANLSGTDFTSAFVEDTIFANVDLSDCEGLEDILHVGPSSIDVETIYRSKGKMPDIFLRGCGLPDDFIAYAKSLSTNPVEYYSCFISYSTKDQAFAERLHADLQNKGVRCWFAPHDVQGGKKLHEQIDEAIRLHDKLLLILSPDSMASEWVKTEIAKARKREVRDKRRVLFPIRLVQYETLRDWECFDADTGKDSAREIREYFIPDFSNWKNHDSYQEAFHSLIRDLKSSDSNKP